MKKKYPSSVGGSRGVTATPQPILGRIGLPTAYLHTQIPIRRSFVHVPVATMSETTRRSFCAEEVAGSIPSMASFDGGASARSSELTTKHTGYGWGIRCAEMFTPSAPRYMTGWARPPLLFRHQRHRWKNSRTKCVAMVSKVISSAPFGRMCDCETSSMRSWNIRATAL